MSASMRSLVFALLNEGLWVVLVTPTLALFATDEWWPGWSPPALVVIGATLLGGGGALTVWAGYHLIEHGGGTPLPVRPPVRLVASGPYARVRNPQSIGGVALMAGVAAALSEPVVWLLPAIYAAYVALLLANERLTLHERFGEEYAEYRAAVPGWVPQR